MLAFLLPPKFKRSSGKKHTTTAKAGKLVPEDAHLQKPTSTLITQNTVNVGKALCPKIATAFEPVTAVAKNQNQFPERERDNRTGNAGKNETKLLRCQSQSAAFYLSKYETTACCSIADRSDVYGKFDLMKTLRAIHF